MFVSVEENEYITIFLNSIRTCGSTYRLKAWFSTYINGLMPIHYSMVATKNGIAEIHVCVSLILRKMLKSILNFSTEPERCQHKDENTLFSHIFLCTEIKRFSNGFLSYFSYYMFLIFFSLFSSKSSKWIWTIDSNESNNPDFFFYYYYRSIFMCISLAVNIYVGFKWIMHFLDKIYILQCIK